MRTWAPDFMWVMVGGSASAMETCWRLQASCKPCTSRYPLLALSDDTSLGLDWDFGAKLPLGAHQRSQKEK